MRWRILCFLFPSGYTQNENATDSTSNQRWVGLGVLWMLPGWYSYIIISLPYHAMHFNAVTAPYSYSKAQGSTVQFSFSPNYLPAHLNWSSIALLIHHSSLSLSLSSLLYSTVLHWLIYAMIMMTRHHDYILILLLYSIYTTITLHATVWLMDTWQ